MNHEMTPAERLQAHALLTLHGYTKEEADKIVEEVNEKFRRKLEEMSA